MTVATPASDILLAVIAVISTITLVGVLGALFWMGHGPYRDEH